MTHYPIKHDPDDVQTCGLSAMSRPDWWVPIALFLCIPAAIIVAVVLAGLS